MARIIDLNDTAFCHFLDTSTAAQDFLLMLDLRCLGQRSEGWLWDDVVFGQGWVRKASLLELSRRAALDA